MAAAPWPCQLATRPADLIDSVSPPSENCLPLEWPLKKSLLHMYTPDGGGPQGKTCMGPRMEQVGGSLSKSHGRPMAAPRAPFGWQPAGRPAAARRAPF